MFVIGFYLIVRTVVTFFALYGLYKMTSDIFSFFAEYNSCHKYGPVIVVKVKNHEESLECVIREIVFRSMKSAYTSDVPDILIVDFGSDDSTPEIARRLAGDFSFVYYTTAELYIKALSSDNDESI